MTRKLCAFIALTLAVAGLTAGSGTQSQYVTSMTFQDGVYPTAGYSGCAATYIGNGAGNADTSLNHGACDTLNLGGNSNVRAGFHPLISFNISDLPDSAVITRARLWIYTLYPSASAISADIGAENIKFHRLFNSWTEGTGTCAGTAQAASADWLNRKGNAWVNSGAVPAAFTSNDHKFWGPGSTATSDSATLGSYFGADTTNSATRTNGALTTMDAAGTVSASTPPKSGNTNAKRLGWLIVDVTADVRQWHIGAVANNGWVMQMDASTNTLTISYASDDYALGSTDPVKLGRRPKLVVEYLDPEAVESASGGGSVRRTVGRTR